MVMDPADVRHFDDRAAGWRLDLSLPETPSAPLRRSDPSSGSPAGNVSPESSYIAGIAANSGGATDKYVVCRWQACVN